MTVRGGVHTPQKRLGGKFPIPHRRVCTLGSPSCFSIPGRKLTHSGHPGEIYAWRGSFGCGVHFFGSVNCSCRCTVDDDGASCFVESFLDIAFCSACNDVCAGRAHVLLEWVRSMGVSGS